jgi:hypothetical protein
MNPNRARPENGFYASSNIARLGDLLSPLQNCCQPAYRYLECFDLGNFCLGVSVQIMALSDRRAVVRNSPRKAAVAFPCELS